MQRNNDAKVFEVAVSLKLQIRDTTTLQTRNDSIIINALTSRLLRIIAFETSSETIYSCTYYNSHYTTTCFVTL